MISFEDFKTSFELFYTVVGKNDEFGEDQGMEWETAEEKSSLKSQAHQKEGIDLVSLFAKCDMDKDGVIDWHDFLMTASNKRRLFSGFNIEETFATIDFY